MKAILLALLLKIPLYNRASVTAAEPFADALVRLSRSPAFEPLPIGKTRDAQVVATLRLYFVWLDFESGFRVDALGDKGRSCGAPQINRRLCDCDRIRRDIDYALERMHEIMRASHARCGTVRGALGYYATGRACASGLALVTRRCLISGGCE